jgi:hypothetical protein
MSTAFQKGLVQIREMCQPTEKQNYTHRFKSFGKFKNCWQSASKNLLKGLSSEICLAESGIIQLISLNPK